MNSIDEITNFALAGAILRDLVSARADGGEFHSQMNILCHHLFGLGAGSLAFLGDKPLSTQQRTELARIIPRLRTREPLALILGETDFYFMRLECNSGVLIPRNDTERLVERALSLLNEGDAALDMCCGSGCIGIALARFARARVTCADISPLALDLTRRNAERNGVSVNVVQSDMFSSITGKYKLIACNPPYIRRDVVSTLESDVIDYEPHNALDGGVDGLDFYRILKRDAFNHLEEDGKLILEIGYDQGQALTRLFDGYSVTVERDYSGNDRVVLIERKSND